MIGIKRVYEPKARGDGYRVLVDRLWPRGLSKDGASIDEWAKHLAPSAALRTWFGHAPERWQGFRTKYLKELEEPAIAAELDRLAALARARPLTLLYGARSEKENQAVVLAEVLGGRQ